MLNNTDIVTIACTSYRGIQELQSYSLDLMVTTPCNHYVVIEDKGMTADEWYAILSPYYTRHKLHIVPSLLSDEYYINDSRIKNGWHRASALKILISEKIQTKKYLILDSKNFFIREQSINDWPLVDGNGIVVKYDPYIWNEVNEFCLTNNIPIPTEVYDSATPFMIDTDIMKKINEHEILPLFFNKKGWWSSEFFLYSIFTQYFGNKLTTEKVPNVTFWNTERKISTEVLTEIYNWPNMRSFGLHKDVIKLRIDLTELINFLVSLGFDRAIVEKTITIYKQDINDK